MKFPKWSNIDTAYLARIPGVFWLFNFFRLLFVPTYRQDGLSTVHNVDFLKNPRFKKAFGAAMELEKMPYIKWRMHILQWAAQHGSNLQGDFVDCGVNKGFFCTAVMEYIDFRNRLDKKYYLFDTFSGLVPELITAEDKAAHRRLYPDVYDQVVKTFKDYSNVVIVRGAIPYTLDTVKIEKVCYLSIDLNCVKPERDALAHFWPKMVQGGIIVLDDYAYKGYEAQKLSADNFAKSVGAEIMSVPTGQGILIKF